MSGYEIAANYWKDIQTAQNEITRLRALVGEMAQALETWPRSDPTKVSALLARAREATS